MGKTVSLLSLLGYADRGGACLDEIVARTSWFEFV
jgi:hypothetical protein